MQCLSSLSGLPGTFEEYIWQVLVPIAMMVLLVLLLWTQIRTVIKYITRGMLECNGEMPSGSELWTKLYRSCLRHPRLWLWFLRFEILLAFTISGVAVGWSGTNGLYLPPIVIFATVGLILALWSVPPALLQGDR